MRSVAIDTVEAGKGVASMVQQELEHGQVLHGEHVDRGEGGWVRRDAGVDVSSMLHQQGDGLDAALPRRHHQGPEHVQVRVGASLQQCAHGINIVVDDREVQHCAAAVLIKLGSFFRQLSVDFEPRLDQNLQNIVTVTLSSEVERANTSPPDSGFTGGLD